ncbi:hypothetical protein ACUXAV_006143 [Cupriavidus metallidurans]
MPPFLRGQQALEREMNSVPMWEVGLSARQGGPPLMEYGINVPRA